jgi:hypothetical protein
VSAPAPQASISAIPNAINAAIPKSYTCPRCPRTFSMKRNLYRHLTCHGREGITYSYSVKSKYSKIRSVKESWKMMYKEKTYTCDVCNTTVAGSKAFRRHCRLHTEFRQGTYIFFSFNFFLLTFCYSLLILRF